MNINGVISSLNSREHVRRQSEPENWRSISLQGLSTSGGRSIAAHRNMDNQITIHTHTNIYSDPENVNVSVLYTAGLNLVTTARQSGKMEFIEGET